MVSKAYSLKTFAPCQIEGIGSICPSDLKLNDVKHGEYCIYI